MNKDRQQILRLEIEGRNPEEKEIRHPEYIDNSIDKEAKNRGSRTSE